MSDFGTLKARVSSEMKRGELSASSAAVQAAVLSAIKHFERRRFHFNEFNDETATASGSTTYVLLSAFSVPPLAIDSLKAIIGARDYPLTERTWHEIDSIDSGQWYGYPEWYSIHAQKIRLYPPPNANYTLKVSGIKRLTEVSAGAAASASNAWTDEAEEMIRLRAKATLFRDELRNMGMFGEMAAEAERSHREILYEKIAKTSSGRIRPTRW